LVTGVDDEDKEILVFFDEDFNRRNSHEQWLEAEWKPWAQEASPKQKIQQMYMDLFILFQRFQREGENFELAEIKDPWYFDTF
jgi:hypothetical protein